MLALNLQQEFLAKASRTMRALIEAEPVIAAAEKLEALLGAAGLAAHAAGHLAGEECNVCVLSTEDPESIEAALLVANLSFAEIDAARVQTYTMRVLRVIVDGREVRLTINHQPGVDVPYREMVAA